MKMRFTDDHTERHPDPVATQNPGRFSAEPPQHTRIRDSPRARAARTGAEKEPQRTTTRPTQGLGTRCPSRPPIPDEVREAVDVEGHVCCWEGGAWETVAGWICLPPKAV